MRSLILLPLLFLVGCATAPATGPDWPEDYSSSMRLWYEQPAEEWEHALPVGNGRMGAMVFGRVNSERIQLNEESLWAGTRLDDANPGALAHLAEVRRLIFEGRNDEAFDLAEEQLMSVPPAMHSYQTLMDLTIASPNQEATNYLRELDLGTGIARTTFQQNGTTFTREVFASAVDDAVIVHLSSDQDGSIDVTLSLSRPQDATVEAVSDSELLLHGQLQYEANEAQGPGGPGMSFAGRLRVLATGGSIRAVGSSLAVSKADEVTLLITGATDYNLDLLDFDRSKNPVATTPTILDSIEKIDYELLRARHVADHAPRMARVQLRLGRDAVDSTPTDVRLQRVKDGAVDPHLTELYFQYGRYLLLGSSRAPGVLPANLQGVWNEHLHAPWNSDYHVNINLQMNYWPAEVTNLPETVPPLIGFMKAITEPGAVTAREMYGAGGWVLHHNTDIFGRTGLHEGIQWGTFPMGGAWMTFPIWRHFLYDPDPEYLRETAYPMLRGASRFVLDFLVEGPQGYLVTTPSYSPENAFVLPETGEAMQLTYAPTMDVQIIHELFRSTIQAAGRLGVDGPFRDSLLATLDRLPPVRVGKNGTIMEWIEDYEEAEPGHRHISHLLGLHPGSTITTETPELFEAARRTIDRRLEHGGGHTGWSRAWIINFFARLRDGNEAHHHLQELYRRSTHPNLFDDHPPFQIDGNFGATAGIAEMLVQSHAGFIDVLPALPQAWSEGSVTGLRVQGNHEIDLAWENGTATGISIRGGSDGPVRVRVGRGMAVTSQGEEITVAPDGEGIITWDVVDGVEYRLEPPD